MAEHELAFIATNDLCAITRGRAMPLAQLDLETRCGWVPPARCSPSPPPAKSRTCGWHPAAGPPRMPSSAGTTARRCSGCRPAIGLGGRDPAAQLNLEFRAADATGNPWLVMGLLIRAGLEGIRQRLPAPEGLDRPIEEVGEDAQRALKLYEMRRLKGLDGGAKCLRYAGVH